MRNIYPCVEFKIIVGLSVFEKMMDAVPKSKLSSVFDSEFLEKYHAFNAAAEQQSFQNFPNSQQNIS